MAISRRSFLARAAGLAQPKRPNVLFIPVDDLNRSLHCFGNPQVKSPNIDRLAQSGVRFTTAFSNYASCLPSRISFLSGWYPERTGVMTFTPKPRDRQLRNVVYLPEHFRNNGYRTARLDKVFHIGGDEPSCWDISEEPIKDEQGRNKVVFTPREIEAQGLRPRILEEGDFRGGRGERSDYAIVDADERELIDSLNTRRASQIMEQYARENMPFFMACGLRRPHLPRIVPKKYVDMYPPERIEISGHPPNYDPATWLSDKDRRRIHSLYYAATTYMDARVGELLGTLDRLRIRDNTIVVLFGDNGYALGERDNHYGKGTLGERSFAVPLIISAPGMKQKGAACERVVELLDIYPTLVGLCNLPTPASKLQGRSLKPLLDNPRANWQERAIGATGRKDYSRPGLTVRTARYRYSENVDRKPLELFDYSTDPLEWRNLIEEPGLANVRKQMAAILSEDRT